MTLPRAILAPCPETKYFDVTVDNGRIVLTPMPISRADAVRAKLADLGITEDDVADAVAWAQGRAEAASNCTESRS